MRCRHFQDLVDAFIDGETDESVNAHMVEHMGICAECKFLYKKRRDLFQMLKDGAGATVGIDVSDFVMEQIALLPAPGKSRSYKSRILYVVLPVVLAIGSISLWKFTDVSQVINSIGLFNRMATYFYFWGESTVFPHQILDVLNAFRVIAHVNIQFVVRIAVIVLIGLPLKAPIIFFFTSITFFGALWCRKLSKRSSSMMVII